jgi:hypothetical protein
LAKVRLKYREYPNPPILAGNPKVLDFVFMTISSRSLVDYESDTGFQEAVEDQRKEQFADGQKNNRKPRKK